MSTGGEAEINADINVAESQVETLSTEGSQPKAPSKSEQFFGFDPKQFIEEFVKESLRMFCSGLILLEQVLKDGGFEESVAVEVRAINCSSGVLNYLSVL